MESSPKPPEMRTEDQESLKSFLEIYDFNPQILQDIFDEQARRSGKERSNIKVSVDDIKVVRGLLTGLARTKANGEISIDIEKLEKHVSVIRALIIINMKEESVEVRDLVLKAAMHYLVIQTITHELGHVHSSNVYTSYPEMRTLQSDWGYETTRLNQDTNLKSTINNALNEAVTETLGREIYHEYSKRAGDSFYADVGGSFESKLDDFLLETTGERGRSYENLVRTFDLLMEHIAKELEVPKEKVWEAFKQGYFAGLPAISTWLMEISSFLEAEFPKMIDTDEGSEEWDPEIFESKLKAWEQSQSGESMSAALFAQLFEEKKEA